MTIGLLNLGRNPQTVWQTLPLGGGGFVSGLDIAPDGTKVCRTDTNGAYLRSGSTWVQLVTTFSLPASVAFQSQGTGVYEIRIAPSNTNHFYMIFAGYLFSSVNKGSTWTQTAFAQDTTANPNENSRGMGYRLAVDPQNENVVVATTTTGGPFITTNAGTSWAAIGGITAASPATGGYLVAFDPSSAVVGGKTQGIYLASYGTGVYHSTNGGTSWTLTASTPTFLKWLEVSRDGFVYATTDETGSDPGHGGSLTTVQVYTGSGSWTGQVAGAGGNFFQSIRADPGTTGRVVAVDLDGNLTISTNHGSTWTGKGGHSITSTDVPWLTYTNGGAAGAALFGCAISFDPSVSNTVYHGFGLGVASAAPPSTQTTAVWTSVTAGIEQLVANDVIKPPSGNPIMCVDDQGVFVSTNLNAYPSAKYTTNNATGLQHGWGIDFSPSTPTTIVALINIPFTSTSGYSLDGGATWSLFATSPPNFGPSASQSGGSIAVSAGAALGTTNIVVVGTDQGGNTSAPYYSTDGGSTWTICGGAPTSGWGGNAFFNHKLLCSDRVTAGTFYLYNPSFGVYKSTNSGATFTQVNASLFSGAFAAFVQLQAVPSNAGHLFCTLGKQNNLNTSQGTAFHYSTNGGTTWTNVPNVTDVWRFGFGKPRGAGGYPAMYIAAYVNNVWGIWRSDNANADTPTWTQIGDFPTGDFCTLSALSGDPDLYGRVYAGLSGSGFVYGTLF